MKKTVGVLRRVYTNALKNFPLHRDAVAAHYERIMASQMGKRTTWISNNEELCNTAADMLIVLEVFLEKICKNNLSGQKKYRDAVFLRPGHG